MTEETVITPAPLSCYLDIAKDIIGPDIDSDVVAKILGKAETVMPQIISEIQRRNTSGQPLYSETHMVIVSTMSILIGYILGRTAHNNTGT